MTGGAGLLSFPPHTRILRWPADLKGAPMRTTAADSLEPGDTIAVRLVVTEITKSEGRVRVVCEGGHQPTLVLDPTDVVEVG